MNDLPSAWGEDNTREHTFSTGRAARVRRSVNLFALSVQTGLGVDMVDGKYDENLKGGEVVLGILQHIWVVPRILGPADDRTEDELINLALAVEFQDLDTAEVLETLELWKEAATNAARFRGDPAGVGVGEGGEGVEDEPKQTARPKSRKSGSVRR